LLENIRIINYVVNGRKPWTRGYSEYRNRFISQILRDEHYLNKFKHNELLSKKYGTYLDERTVEYPWLMSRLDNYKSSLLDAGSILNHSFIINSNIIKNKNVTIVTLEPERNCFWSNRISYNYTDIRELPYKDNYFDNVVTISTLEHIGMDNSLYSDNQKYVERKTDDYSSAIVELKRVLKESGKLFLTVPFGRYMNFGWYQQFNSDMIDNVIGVFSPKKIKETYFCYENDGWQIVDRKHCSGFEGFDIHQTKYFNKKSKKGYDPDFAACSRAIAALELWK
jgi:hypothetical protein